MSLYYNVPPVVIGFPLYKHDSCIDYIITNLQKSGLFVSKVPAPNNTYIYISWKLDDISQKAKNKLLLH